MTSSSKPVRYAKALQQAMHVSWHSSRLWQQHWVARLQVQSSIDVDQPLFQPFPPEVVFHTYAPFKQYEAVLRLRNNDKVW